MAHTSSFVHFDDNNRNVQDICNQESGTVVFACRLFNEINTSDREIVIYQNVVFLHSKRIKLD